MKTTLLRCFLLLGALGLGWVPAARGVDLMALRSRFEQRLPAILALKASGALGENNLGYLEVRKVGEAVGLAAAENADRQDIYAAIAKKTGASLEQVGRARAKRIAERSAPGAWLQHEDGSWYRK